MDWALLRELQADARVSFSELSRRVHLSPPAVAERVRRLEESGVVTGYHAHVDLARAGRAMVAMIRMSCYGANCILRDPSVAQWPEILEIHRITGDACSMLKVATSSIDAFEQVIDRLAPYGQPSSTMVLSSPQSWRAVTPLPRRQPTTDSACRPVSGGNTSSTSATTHDRSTGPEGGVMLGASFVVGRAAVVGAALTVLTGVPVVLDGGAARAGTNTFVEVTPNTAQAGSRVNLRASCDNGNNQQATVNSDAFGRVIVRPNNGFLTGSVTIPGTRAPGNYAVNLTCQNGNTASTTLTVVNMSQGTQGPATGGGGTASGLGGRLALAGGVGIIAIGAGLGLIGMRRHRTERDR